MTDASTPRPWHVYDDRQFTVYPGIDAAKDSVIIFGLKNEQCGVRGDTLEARKANAALIVRAVNAHDDLVAALRSLLDTSDIAGYHDGKRGPCKTCDAVKAAKAALKKATT